MELFKSFGKVMTIVLGMLFGSIDTGHAESQAPVRQMLHPALGDIWILTEPELKEQTEVIGDYYALNAEQPDNKELLPTQEIYLLAFTSEATFRDMLGAAAVEHGLQFITENVPEYAAPYETWRYPQDHVSLMGTKYIGHRIVFQMLDVSEYYGKPAMILNLGRSYKFMERVKPRYPSITDLFTRGRKEIFWMGAGLTVKDSQLLTLLFDEMQNRRVEHVFSAWPYSRHGNGPIGVWYQAPTGSNYHRGASYYRAMKRALEHVGFPSDR